MWFGFAVWCVVIDPQPICSVVSNPVFYADQPACLDANRIAQTSLYDNAKAANVALIFSKFECEKLSEGV